MHSPIWLECGEAGPIGSRSGVSKDVEAQQGALGPDTIAGLHGHPDVMWTEEYQADYVRGHLEAAARKDCGAGMQVWNSSCGWAVRT